MSTFVPGASLSADGLPSLSQGSRVAVIGAGAFGGWAALWLQQLGCKVTLIDAVGPGQPLSSSGDESRIIRTAYGQNQFYFQMASRATALWKEYERLFDQPLFRQVGALWFCHGSSTPLIEDAIPFARAAGHAYECLTPSQLRSLHPAVEVDDLTNAWLDRDGGYLLARQSCEAVVRHLIKMGGTFRQAKVQTPVHLDHPTHDVQLSDGTRLTADVFVFACGSWLPKLFPEVLTHRISATRQEVFYLEVPADVISLYASLPAWVDADGTFYHYGMPGLQAGQIKVGRDLRGPALDPDTTERQETPEVLESIRAFLAKRFPGLRDARVVEHKVCPYENTVDGNFLFESHPQSNNVLLLGGGSGHGFKHGPALGEWVARALVGLPSYF